MSPQKSEEKMNKALEIASNDNVPQIAVPPETGGKEKIIISGDIIRKFFEWVPLEKLPNVILVGRRYWLYGEDNLEKRKYVIQRLYLIKDSQNIYRLQVSRRRTTIDGKSLGIEERVEIAEVAPPMNFRLKALQIACNIDVDSKSKALKFLLNSEGLFVGAKLIFAIYHQIDSSRLFLQAFNRCAEITIKSPKGTSVVVQSLFSNLSHCNSLVLSYITNPGCVNESLFDWLHSPATIYPDMALPTHKQLYFVADRVSSERARGLLTKLTTRIKEKFLKDGGKKQHKFVVKFAQMDIRDIHMNFREENAKTGELLFSRFENDLSFNVIRCSKKDEATMAYDKHYATALPKITLA